MQNGCQIVALGELLIDMIPGQIGLPLSQVRSFYPKPGGAPANVAVGASRLGCRAGFIGKVGQDPFGSYLAEVLSREGVDIHGLRFDPEARTTMALVALPDANSTEFMFYRNPGADQLLTSAELDEALIRSARIFHFGTVSLTEEPCRAAVWQALQIARNAGVLISCDINYRPALWPSPERALQEIDRILPLIDLLKVNEFEAGLLTGEAIAEGYAQQKVAEAAAQLLKRGPRLVVVTLGAAGSCFRTSRAGDFLPAYGVDIVDTVGCGDAFTAGLLAQLCAGDPDDTLQDPDRIRGAVRFANAVGALTSMKAGAIPAMPRREQVEDFLAAQE